ncbi:MAG: hypothetical protein WBO45_08630 [Planctomycetota bacterium]
MHDAAWVNPTASGTPTLTARVCYPSPTGGVDAPILPASHGWPVIVFLHGYSLVGSDYATLGAAWASQGFAVVLLETAQWDYGTLAADGAALFAAITTGDPDEFFRDAFDCSRIGIAGHSMGAGSMGLLLGGNPGYRCALALAPLSPGAGPAAQVNVPFGLVAGTGDYITPPFVFSQPYYQAVAPATGMKFFYLMNNSCGHMNLAGFAGAANPVFRRTNAIAVGFFRHFLDIDPNGLDQCVGPPAYLEPRLVGISQQVVEPRVWAAGPFEINRTNRISVAAEEGLGGVLAALSTGAGTLTSVGILLLDPMTAFSWASGNADRMRRIDAFLYTPNNPALIGSSVAFQAIGPTTLNTLRLGSAAQFVVGQ